MATKTATKRKATRKKATRKRAVAKAPAKAAAKKEATVTVTDALAAVDGVEVFEERLKQILTNMVEGSAEDIATFAQRISSQILIARLQGDSELLASLYRQMRMLGEASRLRAADAQWAALAQITDLLAGTISELAVRVATKAALAIV